MGIKEDIFGDFFGKLEMDADFPNDIVKRLRILWESNEIPSREEILNAILGGNKDSTDNQDY